VKEDDAWTDRPWAAAVELAQRQQGAITRRQLDRLGIDRRMIRRRLRQGLVAEPRPGVLVLGGVPATWLHEVALATLAGGGTVASHRTAARLHGLDGFTADTTMEVTVVTPRGPRVRGVKVHQVQALDRADVTRVDGIVVTGLARTMADLGSVCPPDKVLQALDDVRRRGHSLAWLRQTAERLRRPGQRGPFLLLELLDQVSGEQRAPDSWFERLLERCLASPDLPPLHRQYEVRDRRGRFVARLDAAFPAIKLGIEAHSRRYHDGDRTERVDENRDLRLAVLGWEVMYVRWQHLEHPDQLVASVLQVAEQRAVLLRAVKAGHVQAG
jgi:hypothetical protein